MPMPQTAMNEYDSINTRENQIWFARQIFAVKAVAEATGENSLAKHNLRSCVFSFHLSHNVASRIFIYGISHKQLGGENLFL